MVQHVLQVVELFMVKHTDCVNGYLLRGNFAVCDVRLVHRAVTVRMDGMQVGIDCLRLLFGWVWCCSFVLNIADHLADCVCQERVTLCDTRCQLFHVHLLCPPSIRSMSESL